MAGATRARIVQSAALLFRERGFDGTGLREVVERAGSARGAIYHHFPGGKPEIGVAAANWAGSTVAEIVEDVCRTSTPEQAVARLLDLVEALLIDGELPPGCPVAAVALAADDPAGELRSAAAGVFHRWRDALIDVQTRHGTDLETARDRATTAIACVEGAIILCRAERSSDPMASVRKVLGRLVAS